MSFFEKDSTIIFTWGIAPTTSPLVKADYDITLVLPTGVSTYTDDGVTTYVAPTATASGSVTYNLTPALLGLYEVTLSTGDSDDHIIQAYRRVYVVTTPSYIINGATPTVSQGPRVQPPRAPRWGTTGETYNSSALNSGGEALLMSPDGSTILYMGTTSSNGVYEIDIVSPGELSTAAYNSVFLDVTTQTNSPKGMQWNGDGTALWVSAGAGNGSYFMWEYTLPTPYKLSGGSWSGKRLLGSVFNLGNQYNFCFNGDGTKIYVSDSAGNDVITQYSLATAYDPSGTVTPDSMTLQLGTTPEATLFQSFQWDAAGEELYVEQRSTYQSVDGYALQIYSFTDVEDISTGTLRQTLDFAPPTDSGRGFCLGTRDVTDDWIVFNDMDTTDLLREYLKA